MLPSLMRTEFLRAILSFFIPSTELVEAPEPLLPLGLVEVTERVNALAAAGTPPTVDRVLKRARFLLKAPETLLLTFSIILFFLASLKL